ncbi:MAG: sulfurtransferase [Desulfobulbaceae bacterium]|nr:sulfurtransferase [Desulfobulbaceae bacterium]
MKWKSLFNKVESLDAEDARKFIANRSATDYQLLDVRQPSEYENEHLPGARLIPLKQLPEKQDDLDRQKPLLVYCASGGRSRAAAQFLAGQGFGEVYNISGGIKKWQGGKAAGPEMAGLELIDPDVDYENGLTLSYGLEDGLQKFYAGLAEKVEDDQLKKLLTRLAGFEDKHKAWLAGEYSRLIHRDVAPPLPRPDDPLMEGGRSVKQFLARVRPEFLSIENILDMAMMFETQAMDLYSRLAQRAEEQASRDLFLRLVDEEKTHLGFLEEESERLTG